MFSVALSPDGDLLGTHYGMIIRLRTLEIMMPTHASM